MDKLGSKTIIGAGASFKGKIVNARVIEINGKMNADLTADKVTIGEAGHFDGAIRADLVVVSGHYEGKMQAGSVWATATASISGKLHYETLQMDRGAALNCHVVHNWTAKNTAVAPSENDDADLLMPTTLDKAKNGVVLTSPEEGA
ncbi:polymer-forming cytoskeletal protein [Alphaproteobacteria bacterium]|nr:polymer-forming cytoskeletal protein [Alphaproteobacteria bacterium]